MSVTSVQLVVPYSVILVADSFPVEIPALDGKIVACNHTCVVIGCKSEVDGETALTLGLATHVNPGRKAELHAKLHTPRRVAIWSVLGELLLEIAARNEYSTIDMWINDPVEPDRIVIGVATSS